MTTNKAVDRVGVTPPTLAAAGDYPAVELGRSVRWRYTSRTHHGTCRIDGETLDLRVRIEHPKARVVPDVLGVEAWLRSKTAEPTTVEELAIAAHAALGGRVTVVGSTRTHGRIRVEIG